MSEHVEIDLMVVLVEAKAARLTAVESAVLMALCTEYTGPHRGERERSHLEGETGYSRAGIAKAVTGLKKRGWVTEGWYHNVTLNAEAFKELGEARAKAKAGREAKRKARRRRTA